MKKMIYLVILTIVIFYIIPVIKYQMDLYVTNGKDQEQVIFRIIISGIVGLCVTVCSIIVTAILMDKSGIGTPTTEDQNTIKK